MKNEVIRVIREHPVRSHEEWLAKRTAFLAKEKEFSHLRDELNRQRRELPWEKVEKPYTFDGPDGRVTLAEMFENRHQLVVYHFMFAPEWDEGCVHCSFWADHYDSVMVHLNHRDVTFAVISRAPLAKIERFKQRMGWKFKWFSAYNSDFNYDYYVSFSAENIKNKTSFYNYANMDSDDEDREGLSVFYKDENGAIFHTYSSYARGIDLLNGTYNFLDLVPKGRDEDQDAGPQEWVEYHDRYKD